MSAPKKLSPRPKKSSPKALSPSRILVPVDFSSLSDHALDRAIVVAQHNKAALILVHVVEPVAYPVDFLVVPAEMEDANLQLSRTAKERLGALAKEISGRGIPCESTVEIGRAYHQIVETARKKKADLIVLPTHGHTGLKHVYLGSTAEKVVRHAPCSVLVVR